MADYLYCVVNRHSDGTVGPTLYTQIVEAFTVEIAIATARTIDLDMAALGANAVFLKARESGRIVWTLRTESVDPARCIDLRHKHQG
ncbi:MULTISPECIES: hypothetical protein [unclassified Methylobacterium]|uniref:hypothetical protein n=1 Tax=unclassified Methylobacterium TaxID=2615210 RepID=UPI0011B0803E|nr:MULTISPECIES: hypothetical protein [unclassified Methylobacterium]